MQSICDNAMNHLFLRLMDILKKKARICVRISKKLLLFIDAQLLEDYKDK